MLVRKSHVALWATYLGGMVLSVMGPQWLPANYYFDAATIQEQMQSVEALAFNDSFGNTALLYRWLGLGTTIPAGLIGPASYTAVFVAILASSGIVRARWRAWLFALFAAWNVPLAIYDGTYSKETLAVLVVAAMLRLCGSAGGVVLAALLAAAYAAIFRTYWGVVLVLWSTILIVWRAGGGWGWRLAAVALAIVPLSVASHAFVGLWLSDGRTLVVDAREFDPDSATMFANILPNTSPLTDLLNTAAGWFTLVVPVFLLMLGGVQHVAFAGFQFVNTWLFIDVQRRARLAAHGIRSFDWRFAAASAFCVAYSIVQGMFEPDFGSFAKHETNLAPMLFFVLARACARSATAHEAAVAAVGRP